MRKVIVAIAGLGLLGACGGLKPGYSANSGSVATSRDGKLIYAVDTDNDELEVVDSTSLTKINAIKVGHLPARVIVGSDERIYVSNRGERTVSVLSHDTFTELSRIAVGVEPNGLAFDSAGANLFVVSATDLNDATHGTLTAIDTSTLKTAWSVPVGEEPRGVAVVGNSAYVTSLKKSSITIVDLTQHQVASGVDLSSPDSTDTTVNPNAMSVGGVVEATPAPDGSRVYVPHLWELVGPIDANRAIQGGGSGGAYGSSGPCNSGGSIVSAGVATIDVAGGNVSKVDSLSVCNDPGSDTTNSGAPSTGTKDFPPSLMPSAGTDQHIVQGPSAAVVDRTGLWLFVANRNSNNVVVMPTHSRTINGDSTLTRIVIPVGAAPDGIALSPDGQTAYVYSQFDHALSVISQGSDVTQLKESQRIPLTHDTLSADQVAGRRMFFSATDPRVTSPTTGIACSSCHLEGREDGHVWQFPDGPRQTPLLAGRHLEDTAPYHWAGLFPELKDFYRETVIGRMGGMGLADNEADQVTSFIEAMPAPENPFQGRPDLQAAQSRGAAAFTKATCVQCHAGEVATDNSLHNVGTLHAGVDFLEVLSDGLADPSATPVPLQAVNTPSLLGLARSAPYLHDGSVATLRARLNQAQVPDPTTGLFLHGNTSVLSGQEMDDLEEYLRAL